MNKVYFSHDEILERPNKRYSSKDAFQIHYHFRPARPANFCVTQDVETGEINVSAGTIGPLTWVPYTMCLHINKHGSPHTYNNLKVGSKCVISLPGKDIVNETWFTALPFPRGISELEVAGLHTFPSKFIEIPGVLECPINFECVVEHFVDYYTHGIFFVKVIGASINEEVLSMEREDVVHWFPTYEVDDLCNEFGGSIERLGVMGELFECPTFPIAPKKGWYQTFDIWMNDLWEEKYINDKELRTILDASREYESLFSSIDSERRKELKDFITKVSSIIVRSDWNGLHIFLEDSRL